MTTSAAIPIYEGQDFYVPYFEVKLQGRPLGQDVVRDITQVTYRDGVEEIDSFEITINNWDAEKLDFKYTDKDLFDPGKVLEVWMGYYGRDRLQLMIKGEINSLRPTYPAAGQPTLAVTGLNLLHRLRISQESHPYEDKTDSQIAKEIEGRINSLARQNQLELNVQIRTDDNAARQEKPYEYLFQDNRYNIIFLMERARRIGYDLFVEESEGGQSNVYFGPSVNVKRVTYRLTYGRSLIQFQPNLTTANQVGEVIVRGWDQKKKEKIEAKATRSQIRTRGVGQRGRQSSIEQSFNQRKEIIANVPINSPEEANTLARETLENISKDMVKGTGSTVGLPNLRAGSVVEIDGLGDRFSGRYFVTKTIHSMGDGGYTTQFECRREEL
jgi:phage protein D